MWPRSVDQSVITTDSVAHHETASTFERISTIAGSLDSTGSLLHGEPLLDTDHTDFNSDYEVELRRDLLKDQWKVMFDSIDPEGFGEILVDDFIIALKSTEIISEVPLHKREILRDIAMKAQAPKGPGLISFQDFVNVI